MSDNFNPDASIDIPCPECGYKSEQKIARLKTNPEIVCGGCGKTIHIDASKFTEGLTEAERLIEKFKEEIRRKFSK